MNNFNVLDFKYKLGSFIEEVHKLNIYNILRL